MGRRRKPVKKLQIGTVYFVDRRFYSFTLFEKIKSRQTSANLKKENVKCYLIPIEPEQTTFMVLSHETFFGKEYVKVLATNTKDVAIGYITLKEFLHLIKGSPKWINQQND
jgi:hypothetical protein